MSKALWKVWMVSIYRLRDKFIKKRSIAIFLVSAMYLYLQEEGVRTFCKNVQMKCTPWVFSFLTSDWIAQMMISGIFIWFVAVLSEQAEADSYIIYRTGTALWEFGSILCMVMITFLFVVSLVIVSQIVLLPYLDVSTEWGYAWNLLSKTDAASTYHVSFSLNPYMLHVYTPVKAFLLSFLLQFLSLLLLGIVQYCMNKFARRNFGTFFAAALILMDVLLANTSGEQFYKFSPVTLAQLGNYTVESLRYGYSLKYAVVFYIVSGIAVILLMLCSQTWRNYEADKNRKHIKSLR